ncbi:hypothetical protein CAPTEDRAFT_199683 [Capitella teleta]|uniref:Uncharacterized protein n=1 Tax=Capitella teleta TaxID=283909 RepID=R7VAE6_CAPTE|nr:hypothetical protein CAPTEDRAFT_199683 [Capitella teleta]|eukprot:ELU13306.1 hypothetical protein CAPTEDRAFT_199683 [Capitella teleta]
MRTRFFPSSASGTVEIGSHYRLINADKVRRSLPEAELTARAHSVPILAYPLNQRRLRWARHAAHKSWSSIGFSDKKSNMLLIRRREEYRWGGPSAIVWMVITKPGNLQSLTRILEIRTLIRTMRSRCGESSIMAEPRACVILSLLASTVLLVLLLPMPSSCKPHPDRHTTIFYPTDYDYEFLQPKWLQSKRTMPWTCDLDLDEYGQASFLGVIFDENGHVIML